MRISHIGDRSIPVLVERFGDGMAAYNNNYLYFFIEDPDIRAAQTVTMSVTFFDDAPGYFRIQYPTTKGVGTDVTIPKEGTGTYVTVQVRLDECDFNAEGQNQGMNFRFCWRGAIIQRVEVTTGARAITVGGPPPFAGQTDFNNMYGKVMTGAQFWFGTYGLWPNWSGQGIPGPGRVSVEVWPAGWDDYRANNTRLYDTNFRMPDGSAAQLYNGRDAEAMRTQFQWMRDNDIAGLHIGRFFVTTSIVDTGDTPTHINLVKDIAEETGRLIYISYDFTAAGDLDQSFFVERVQLDWIYNIENKGIVSSPNYAHAEGKPVVLLGGMFAASTQQTRWPSVEVTLELIEWFKGRGYYVIGGIFDDMFWDLSGKHPRAREFYSSVDMIFPWYVGRDVAILQGGQWLDRGMEFARNNPRAWANNQPIAFYPTIWPGFGWTNKRSSGGPNRTPRNAGQWLWTQARTYLRRDNHSQIQSFFLAMYDEYDEGTVLMKSGVDFFDIPLDQYFLTHATDGTWVSSDYYLRLSGAISRALRDRTVGGADIGPLNEWDNPQSVIVPHSLGPVFWRNSFERREGSARTGNTFFAVHHVQIDVGVPHGRVLDTPVNVTVSGPFTINRPYAGNATSDTYTVPSTTLGMVYTNARSGASAFRLAGTRDAGDNALYRYRVATTRIPVQAGLRLSYWHRAENALGANVIVDLLLDDGTYISDSLAAQNTGTPQGGWQQRTLTLPAALNGRYITAVIVAYRDSASAAGSFAAFIDDIIISN